MESSKHSSTATENVKSNVVRILEEASAASKRGTQHGETRQFEDCLTCLFDIAVCQCEDLLMCHCAKEMKVTAREHDFSVDQRVMRRM